MSHNPELSHRQEKEQEKQEHARSTPGKFLRSRNPSLVVLLGVVIIGAIVLAWIFLMPTFGPPN